MNDSLHSLFLAQGMGLYLLIAAIIMFARAGYYQKLLTHLKVGSSTIVLAASMGLMLGIVLVLVHNIWIMESEVLVTLVAWLLLIKSILWLSFPEQMVDYAKKMYSGTGYYGIVALIGILGILLMAHGFHLFK